MLAVPAGQCQAQTRPDTAMNNLIGSDSLARARRGVIPVSHSTAVANTKPLVTEPFQPNPKRAALLSAMLPGAGQIYNRQYWKVALVYAGVGASAYFLVDNTNQYQKYRKAYVARLTDPNVQDEFTNLWTIDPNVTRNNLQTLQDAYKRYLDLTILLTAVGYTLQVLDALAFAHLKNFDISPNISMRLRPVAMPNNGAGVGLVMQWKNGRNNAVLTMTGQY